MILSRTFSVCQPGKSSTKSPPPPSQERPLIQAEVVGGGESLQVIVVHQVRI
jgi:hypothetical protein